MALHAGKLHGMGQARRVPIRFAEVEPARTRVMPVERLNEVVSDARVRLRVTGLFMLGFASTVTLLSAL